MGFKFYAFVFAMGRWVALGALALVPTIFVVVAYRKFRGDPLWTLADLPLAAEVTLCLAWLSVLSASAGLIKFHFSATTLEEAAATLIAACVAAIPVALGYYEIGVLRRRLGLRTSPNEHALTA